MRPAGRKAVVPGVLPPLPRIFEAPEIGPAEQAVLDSIRGLWEELRFNLQQRPNRWTGTLARRLRAKAIRGSNSIEGIRVTAEDALAIVDGSATEADDDDVRAVERYRQAMDYVLAQAGAPGFVYSTETLRALHFMVTHGEVDVHPGTWRPGPIWVKDSATGAAVYEGPAVEEVPSLLEALIENLKATKEDVPRAVVAAMAHLNLVMIHPFSDGNGRMARILQSLVLARAGVLDPTFSSIEEYLGRNQAAYYAILAEVGAGRWSPQRDARPWLRFCLTAHLHQALTVKRRLDTTAAVGTEVEAELRRRGLPERCATSVVNAALGERLRSASYQHNADVSAVGASRDLRALTAAGFLVARGEKRGRTYTAADWLLRLAVEKRDRRPLEDPFEAEP